MNIEKYTERARGFVQSAQSLAMRDGHQQFSSLHMLKVLLDDSEGLAGGLIDRAGGNSRAILKATEDALKKLPKVSGSGAGQIYLAPELARAFDAAEKAAEKAGDSFVTVERLLLGDRRHVEHEGRLAEEVRTMGDLVDQQREEVGLLGPQQAPVA